MSALLLERPGPALLARRVLAPTEFANDGGTDEKLAVGDDCDVQVNGEGEIGDDMDRTELVDALRPPCVAMADKFDADADPETDAS